MDQNLNRYIDAQQSSYAQASIELRKGKKTTHWMWFIFPQIQGLGYSDTSKFYALASLEEARDYLAHPVLGQRLIEISNIVLELAEKDPRLIFGSPDDLKLHSCMTLFASLESTDSVFQKVIDKFFNGVKDRKTGALINQ